MPPKKTAKRRSRKETLQEDLTKLIREENINDEEVFPILKEALGEGVDVNLVADDQTLMCYFAFYGMLKCFEECFLRGADPTIVTSEFPDDALVSAVGGYGSQPIVSRIVMALLNHVKVTNFNHEKALNWACSLGRFEVVRLLLRRNNSLAYSVLSWGVWQGSLKLVEMALEFNADVNQRLRDGRYPIHRAAELQDTSILQKLLHAGADIEAKNMITNETPFEVTVRCNSVNCVRLLIDRKCRLVSQDALLLAARCRSHDVLRELLRNEEMCKEAKQEARPLLFTTVAQDDITAFRIIYPIATFHIHSIHQLVRFQKYDMLSAALFEFEHPGLTTEDLTPMMDEAPNDDFKALLQKKIDAMNGVDLVMKVKEEAEEEEEEEELQSPSKTKKKPTKTTAKSKKK